MKNTNRLLLINAILLFLMLSVQLVLKYDEILLKLGWNQEETIQADSTEIIENKYFQKQDSLKINLDGLKNDTIPLPDEVLETLKNSLDDFNWNNVFQTGDLNEIYHQTVFAQEYPSANAPGRKLIVVSFSNDSQNFYHAARGMLSLFEFQKEQSAWKMTKNYLAFGIGTEYGMEPLGCELVTIGNNNKYALIVQTSYSGNWGHEMETQSVYSDHNSQFELVFNFINFEHYENPSKEIEYTEGYSSMRIRKSDKVWFDIETKREGTDWKDKTPGAVKLFVFDGEEYSENL